jgi:hypothetical protein
MALRRKNQIMIYHNPQTGAGFFQDVNGFLKKNKVLSRGFGALGGMIPGAGGTIAGGVGSIAGQLGYGPVRRRRAAPKKRKPAAKRRPRRK